MGERNLVNRHPSSDEALPSSEATTLVRNRSQADSPELMPHDFHMDR
jgi:hypothetical protein